MKTTLDASSSISTLHPKGQRSLNSNLLRIEQVECLVESAIAASTTPHHANVQEIRIFFQTLRHRLRGQNLYECRNAMRDVLLALEDLVSNSPNLPSATVYEMHSCIGLLHLYCEEYAAAEAAFVKALWVATSTTPSSATSTSLPPEDHDNNNKQLLLDTNVATARTLHRLGVSLVQAGDYLQGRMVLEKALDEYCKAKRGARTTRYRTSALLALQHLDHLDGGGGDDDKKKQQQKNDPRHQLNKTTSDRNVHEAHRQPRFRVLQRSNSS